MIHAAVHYKRDKKWLLHSDLTTVTSFVIAVKKQFQPLRDHLGRPIFSSGPPMLPQSSSTFDDRLKRDKYNLSQAMRPTDQSRPSGFARTWRCECKLQPFVLRITFTFDNVSSCLLQVQHGSSGSTGRFQVSKPWSHQELSGPQQIQAITASTTTDSLELPRSWKSTPAEYDSNREYGLNLPRQVISNKFTRDLQVDGVDILMFIVERRQFRSGHRCRSQCDPDLHD